MAFNRLLRFHIVRSTRPCVFIPACFLGQSEYRIRRDPSHLKEHPNYPDPEYYLNFTQKYFLRHESLRHLRVEQFNRYLWMSGQKGSDLSTLTTAEDTIEDRTEDADDVDENHKNFDEFMESLAPGAHFLPIVKDLPGCKRRSQLRLGISRVPRQSQLVLRGKCSTKRSCCWHCHGSAPKSPKFEWMTTAEA